MGVRGFHSWLRAAFHDASRPTPGDVEVALVDVNGLLHECLRRAGNEGGGIRGLCNELDALCSQHRRMRFLILAADGAAPFAKLREQRERRAKPDAAPSAATSSGLPHQLAIEGEMSSLVAASKPCSEAVS